MAVIRFKGTKGSGFSGGVPDALATSITAVSDASTALDAATTALEGAIIADAIASGADALAVDVRAASDDLVTALADTQAANLSADLILEIDTSIITSKNQLKQALDQLLLGLNETLT